MIVPVAWDTAAKLTDVMQNLLFWQYKVKMILRESLVIMICYFIVIFSNSRRQQMFFIISFAIKYVIAELQFGMENGIQQFIIMLLNKAI